MAADRSREKSAPPDWLPAFLKHLEIPECGCPRTIPCDCEEECDCPTIPAPPCEHIRGSDHDTSIEDWAAMLLWSKPTSPHGEGYAEPPPPKTPARVLSREARVALKAARYERGEGLHSPEDLDESAIDRLGRTVNNAANGRPMTGDLRSIGEGDT